MPQIQTINTSRDKPDPTGIEKFFSRLSQQYKEREDNQQIGQLLEQYKANRDQANAWEDLQLGLESSTISPSRRLETQKSLNETRKNILEKEKVLTQQAGLVLKAQQGPKKTQASQPIDPEQLENIQRVRANPEFEGASPAKKYQMLTDNGVSKENAKAEADIYAKEEEFKPGKKFQEGREKSVLDTVNQAYTNLNEAEELDKVINDIERVITEEDITGPGAVAFAKNNPYLQLIIGLTPGESELQSLNKKMLSGTKSIFGNRPTEREIFLLLNSMLPSIGKTKEANLAGVQVLRKYNNLKLNHAKLIDELTEGGTKYVNNLESIVAKKLKAQEDDLLNTAREANKQYGSNPDLKDNTSQGNAPQGKIRVKNKETGQIGTVTPFEGMESKYELL